MRAPLFPVFTLLCGLSLLAPSVVADTSFLADAPVREGKVQNVLEHQPAKDSQCRHTPTGPIEATLCDFETIESVNDELFQTLDELVHLPFFKFFRVDLYRDCPFWQENGFCMQRECGIDTADESEIPEKWRAATLSKVEIPSNEERKALPGCYYRDSDFCFLDDLTEGDYIDLTVNPEKFTGYAGPSAHRVWNSIYEENCFGVSEETMLFTQSSPDPLNSLTRQEEDPQGLCLEKRVYYKVISGLHASISTHLCADKLNQTTSEWGPDLQCFVSRVASHPERLQYIYFNTVLLMRAVARVGPYLSAYDYCSTGTHEDDAETLERLNKVIGISNVVGKFDESVLFRGDAANVLKEEFKMHFRNVSRIMDCVGCDKCRLWGKVQTTGLGTAFKILFEMDEKTLNPRLNSNLLQRSEVVALINTLHRFTESLTMVDHFRRMWADLSEEELDRLLQRTSSVTAGASPAQSSPAISKPFGITPSNILQTLRYRVSRWLLACKQGTEDCVNTLKQLLGSLFAISPVSDRTQGPRSDL